MCSQPGARRCASIHDGARRHGLCRGCVKDVHDDVLRRSKVTEQRQLVSASRHACQGDAPPGRVVGRVLTCICCHSHAPQGWVVVTPWLAPVKACSQR